MTRTPPNKLWPKLHKILGVARHLNPLEWFLVWWDLANDKYRLRSEKALFGLSTISLLQSKQNTNSTKEFHSTLQLKQTWPTETPKESIIVVSIL